MKTKGGLFVLAIVGVLFGMDGPRHGLGGTRGNKGRKVGWVWTRKQRPKFRSRRKAHVCSCATGRFERTMHCFLYTQPPKFLFAGDALLRVLLA